MKPSKSSSVKILSQFSVITALVVISFTFGNCDLSNIDTENIPIYRVRVTLELGRRHNFRVKKNIYVKLKNSSKKFYLHHGNYGSGNNNSQLKNRSKWTYDIVGHVSKIGDIQRLVVGVDNGSRATIRSIRININHNQTIFKKSYSGNGLNIYSGQQRLIANNAQLRAHPQWKNVEKINLKETDEAIYAYGSISESSWGYILEGFIGSKISQKSSFPAFKSNVLTVKIRNFDFLSKRRSLRNVVVRRKSNDTYSVKMKFKAKLKSSFKKRKNCSFFNPTCSFYNAAGVFVDYDGKVRIDVDMDIKLTCNRSDGFKLSAKNIRGQVFKGNSRNAYTKIRVVENQPKIKEIFESRELKNLFNGIYSRLNNNCPDLLEIDRDGSFNFGQNILNL